MTSVIKPTQQHICSTPQAFLEADKENCDPQLPEPESESQDCCGSSTLPEVISDLSRALETSNGTVQNLKGQLETVLQREMTLQLEYDLLSQRYDNILASRSQTETQEKEKELSSAAALEQTQRRLEESQDVIRQKTKQIEGKNAEIAEFTQRLRGIQADHAEEVRRLTELIDELKASESKSDEKHMYGSLALT